MATLDRRTFLQGSLRLGAGLAAAAATGAPVADADQTDAIPRPCPPEAWTRHGIILEPTEPWEGDDIQNFTCPAEPLEDGRWRLWYSVSGGRKRFTLAFAEGRPGEPMTRTPARRSAGDPPDGPFSIGGLPDDWNPVQGIHLHLRNGRHRLYFWAHGPEVLRYLAAESHDGRHYRVLDPARPVLYHPVDRAAAGIASPDGVRLRNAASRPADEPAAVPRKLSNDATTVYQLPDGTFEMYSVALVRVPRDDPAYIAHDNAPGLLRVIDRYRSDDGLDFPDRRRVIQRDAADPADMQFYYLSMTLTPRGRVGMLGHYRVEAQTMDLEWCFSADGTSWQRPARRPWLPRGDETRADSYGLYAGHALVNHGGKWHLFYTGVNSSHNGRHAHGRPRQVIMHATTGSIWA